MNSLVTVRRKVTAFDNPFSRLKPETEQTERTLDLKRDETVYLLLDIRTKCIRDMNLIRQMRVRPNVGIYDLIVNELSNVKYNAEDVKKLCQLLPMFVAEENFDSTNGYFLSALINSSAEDDFFISTADMNNIENLGFRNCKNITVDGSVGHWLGHEMSEGKIIITGDVGSVGEDMTGGSIIINGNIRGMLGYKMDGGEVTVNGAAEGLICPKMKYGKIRINGDAAAELGPISGGFIWIKGEMLGDFRGGSGGLIYHNGQLKYRWGCRV